MAIDWTSKILPASKNADAGYCGQLRGIGMVKNKSPTKINKGAMRYGHGANFITGKSITAAIATSNAVGFLS